VMPAEQRLGRTAPTASPLPFAHGPPAVGALAGRTLLIACTVIHGPVAVGRGGGGQMATQLAMSPRHPKSILGNPLG
jgi:hypothetical protein